jgi:hypothetical protein
MAAKWRPGGVYAVKIYYSGRLSLRGKAIGQRCVVHNRGFDRCEDKICLQDFANKTPEIMYLLKFAVFNSKNLAMWKLYVAIGFCRKDLSPYFCAGEMAERSNAAVLKTVEVKASGGSNPSLSATTHQCLALVGFSFIQ